jgi:hypothetical protein
VNSEEKPAVTLGVDAGGMDSDNATREHYMALRRLLAAECHGPYGPAFNEFALVLRIDGSVQSWGKRGVDNVRLQRKSQYATADVFVPADAWKNRSSSILRSFLAKEVESAVLAITERAATAKDVIEADRLIADVKRATERFLA